MTQTLAANISQGNPRTEIDRGFETLKENFPILRKILELREI